MSMWPDIEKVSLFDEFPTSVTKLGRTMERFDASRYFAGRTTYDGVLSQDDRAWRLKEKSWLNWAAIVALPAATIDDPLHRDLRDIGIGEQWIDSEERKEIYADPLLAVLFELRNYEVHVELRSGDVKNFHAYVSYKIQPEIEPKDIDHGDEIFISKIDFKSLLQLRNVRSGRSTVTIEMVEWFNRQATSWPASYLIGVARERYAIILENYLRRNGLG